MFICYTIYDFYDYFCYGECIFSKACRRYDPNQQQIADSVAVLGDLSCKSGTFVKMFQITKTALLYVYVGRRGSK